MISQEVLDLLSPGQTVRSQATFACVFGLFWWLIFRLRHPIARYVQKQPYAHRVILVEKKKMSNLGVTLQKDYRALEFYGNWCLITLQHFVGGLFTIPMILGMKDFYGIPSVTLVQLGGLCEVGWELQDCLENFRQAFFEPDWSPTVVPLIVLHHFAAMVMVIPFNLYFPNLWLYAYTIGILQGAASSSLFPQMIIETLDIEKPAQLPLAFWLSIFVSFTAFVCRIAIFPWCAYKLGIFLWTRSGTALYSAFVVAIILMSLFSVLAVADAVERSIKFGKMYQAKKNLKKA